MISGKEFFASLLVLVICLAGFSFAANTGMGTLLFSPDPPNPGHAYTDLEACPDGLILKASGGLWQCAVDATGGGGGGGDSDWSFSGSNIYRSTGNVGIGTSTPASKLQVVGSVSATGVAADSVTTSMVRAENSGVGLTLVDYSGNTVATIKNNRFGIGTSSPSDALDVRGTLRVSNNVIAGAGYDVCAGTRCLSTMVGGVSVTGPFEAKVGPCSGCIPPASYHAVGMTPGSYCFLIRTHPFGSYMPGDATCTIQGNGSNPVLIASLWPADGKDRFGIICQAQCIRFL